MCLGCFAKGGRENDNATRHELRSITDSVLELAAERGRRYVEQVGERRVGAGEKELTGLAKFREAFPEGASDPRSVVAMLDEFGSPATVASTGGKILRVRHWRSLASGTGRELAGGRMGPECRAAGDVADWGG